MKYSMALSAALTAVLSLSAPYVSYASEKLLQVNDVTYLGAFRITDGNYGESKTGFVRGQIAVNHATNTFFTDGRDIYSLAEFNIPELVISDDINDLNYTGPPVQNYVKILDKAGISNPNNLNIMTGLRLHDGKLIINGIEEYNAAADNTYTTMVLDDPFDLANTTFSGSKKLQGNSRAGGWITDVPLEYRAAIGGDAIAGYSSVYSIDGRFSMGPSAYAVNIDDFITTPDDGTIPSDMMVSYSIDNPLTDKPPYNWDEVNQVPLDNDLWTVTSLAAYGMIVPGTRTYFTLGFSSGHVSGLAYKPTQSDTGFLCGGACSLLGSDAYSFAWLYDVNDLIDGKNGVVQPYDVQPYVYGPMDTPLLDADGDGQPAVINGAYYVEETQTLYVVYKNGDTVQAVFSPNALVLAFQFDLASADIIYEIPNDSWTIVHSGLSVLCSSRKTNVACSLPTSSTYSLLRLQQTGKISRKWLACIDTGCTEFRLKSQAMAHLQ